MNRNMTGAMIAALSQRELRSAYLLEMNLSETLRFTNAAVDLSVTWLGVPVTYTRNHLLGFSDITESMELQASRCSVTFSGVDQSGIATVLLYEYLNRPARIYLALFDEAFTVVADPLLMIAGRLDNPVIATDPEAGLCTVSLDIVTRWTPLGRGRARYTNSETQQLLFPGDKGFEHVNEDTQTMVWGGVGHRASFRVPNSPPGLDANNRLVNTLRNRWFGQGSG